MAGFLGKETEAWIKETRDRAPEWFDLAESINVYCHKVLQSIEPHKDNGQEVLGAILFKRILCEFQAVIILQERGMYTDALIQRRGMLEALFVLGAIYQQPDLITDYVKNDIHRRLKIYKNIKERREMGSETLSKLITNEDIDKNIAELTVASKGLRKLHVKDLAEAAGFYDLYLSDYSMLSEAAHHVSKDLERSVSIGSSDDMEYLIWGPEPGDPYIVLFPTVDQMLMATRIVSNIFNLKTDDDLQGFTDKIQTIPAEQ
jgi:hypothetical protein